MIEGLQMIGVYYILIIVFIISFELGRKWFGGDDEDD